MFLMGNDHLGLADLSLSNHSSGILQWIPEYFSLPFNLPFNSFFVTSSYLMSRLSDSCCGGLGEG